MLVAKRDNRLASGACAGLKILFATSREHVLVKCNVRNRALQARVCVLEGVALLSLVSRRRTIRDAMQIADGDVPCHFVAFLYR